MVQKKKATCVLLDKSEDCCKYDSEDCLLSYTDTTLFTGCSGKELCERNQPNSVDSRICGTDYPEYSHYYTMEFYCIQGMYAHDEHQHFIECRNKTLVKYADQYTSLNLLHSGRSYWNYFFFVLAI